MTSLVPGLEKRKLHFFANLLLCAPDQSLNSKIINQCNIDFNFLEEKRGPKCHFIGTLIVHKFVGVSSKHLRVFLESLRESSEIFEHLRKFSEILRKCSGTFVCSSEQFWEIFGNLRKIVKNPVSLAINQ